MPDDRKVVAHPARMALQADMLADALVDLIVAIEESGADRRSPSLQKAVADAHRVLAHVKR